jgi:hypothetical protein
MIFDPPEGWRYGFPKTIPKDCKSISEWLKECNYPEHLMELAERHSRYIDSDREGFDNLCPW